MTKRVRLWSERSISDLCFIHSFPSTRFRSSNAWIILCCICHAVLSTVCYGSNSTPQSCKDRGTSPTNRFACSCHPSPSLRDTHLRLPPSSAPHPHYQALNTPQVLTVLLPVAPNSAPCRRSTRNAACASYLHSGRCGPTPSEVGDETGQVARVFSARGIVAAQMDSMMGLHPSQRHQIDRRRFNRHTPVVDTEIE